MKENAIKVNLHDKIEHADSNQLRDLFGLITNYFNGQETKEEWAQLPEIYQRLIIKSIEQADAGLGTPAKEVTKRIRDKYGLNG